ncbi:MAG: 30S ribosomal protein S16 [Bacteroidetes bacterium]|nr:30S ribosomal protein S16 [Bacteroidota bacterium]
MVKIRLRREGKKKYPIYKIVAADARSPRDGGYLEALGQYNPHTDPITITLREDKVETWLKRGAQPTETVRSLLKRTGFWLRWTLRRQGKDQETIQKVMERWQMLQAEKAKREAERKQRRKAKKKSSAQQAEASA